MRDFSKYFGFKEKEQFYKQNADLILKELEEKLYNENLDLYADYVGMQWEPVLSAKQ